MKKGHGHERALPVVDRAELEQMPTGALLARLKRLRWCEEGENNSELLPHELAMVEGKILYKNDPLWKAAYSDLKAILATREHVDRKIG